MGDSEEEESAGGSSSAEEAGARTALPTKTEEQEIKGGDYSGGAEIDEEDNSDEFGEFEQAAVGESDVVPASTPEAADERHFTASAAPPLRHISEFLNDPSLWEIANDHEDAEVSGAYNEESQPQPPYYDLVAAFDAAAGDCSHGDEEREGLPELSASTRVMELWLALHCIEETPALRFQWLKSHTYAKLLLALEIPGSTITTPSGSKISGGGNNPDSASAGRRTLNTVGTAPNTRNNDSGGNISSEVEVAVDSLSVPPADFDWQSAGLSNPLKGSSAISNIAMLDCDEFFKTQSVEDGVIKGYNSQSILEKDLQALGIDVGLASSNLSNGHIPSAGSMLEPDGSKITADELLRRNEHRRENDPSYGERTARSVASNKARAYKTREELSSDEGRAFHDRLPDLSYMLSDRLIFPAAPSGSEAVRRENRSTDES